MKALLPTLIVGLMATAAPVMNGQSADLLELSSLIGNYNLISFGTANLSLINNEAQGPIAAGGNLSVGGDPLVTIASFDNSPNPDLYVQGTFSIANNGVVQLNNGFASLPGNAGTGTYPLGGNNTRYQPAGTTGWLQVNSNVTDSNTDPRTNPTGVWSGSTMSNDQTALTQVSQDLAGDAANGTIGVSGQNLVFTGAASGVTIFNLNANLLTQSGGSTFYNGQRVSSISFNIPSNALYVVNLQNANGRTIFGQGFNFNSLSGNQASQLLWNVEPSAGNGTTTVTLGNGGEFYGSVLAPQVNLLNGLNTPINGQVVADTITYDNAELEFTAFDPQAAIPEPAAYAAFLGTAVLAFAAWRYRRGAAACAGDRRLLSFGLLG